MNVLWNTLCCLEPKFGYYPRASKSWLIFKKIKLKEHAFYLRLAKIETTSTGKNHLGAVIGLVKHKDEYMNDILDIDILIYWILDSWKKILSWIAKNDPQAVQFVIFKPLSYCFEETIGFDVKASFASRSGSRLIRCYNKPGEITKEFW